MTTLKYCEVSGKIRFPTFYAADRVQRECNQKHHHIGGMCYRCSYCHDWHLTHFTETVTCFYKPKQRASKKIMRSIRNRAKNNKPINYYIIMSNVKMKRRVVFEHMKFVNNNNATIAKVFDGLDRASADIKNNMGVCIGCTRLVYSDMRDHLRKLPQYRQQVKKAFNNVDELWTRWENDAISTPDSRRRLALFTLGEFEPSSTEVFRKGVSDREYFDLVMGTGGSAYVKSWQQMMCLRYKFEKLYEQKGIAGGAELSWLDLVGMLLQLCVDVYNARIEFYSKELCSFLLFPSPDELFGTLNIEPVVKAFFSARDMLPCLKVLDETQVRNLALTADDIRQQWISFESLVQHINTTCDNYDDVMASKAEIRRLKISNEEKLQKFRQEQKERQLEEIKEKLNKKQTKK